MDWVRDEEPNSNWPSMFSLTKYIHAKVTDFQTPTWLKFCRVVSLWNKISLAIIMIFLTIELCYIMHFKMKPAVIQDIFRRHTLEGQTNGRIYCFQIDIEQTVFLLKLGHKFWQRDWNLDIEIHRCFYSIMGKSFVISSAILILLFDVQCKSALDFLCSERRAIRLFSFIGVSWFTVAVFRESLWSDFQRNLYGWYALWVVFWVCF